MALAGFLGCPAHAQPEGSSEELREDRSGVTQGEFGAEFVIEEDEHRRRQLHVE